MTVVAGKHLSGYCSNLCTGDFNRKATVELRAIESQNFGETSPSEEFTVVFPAYFYVKTVKGTKRFDGINIKEDTTHLYVARWRSAINNLDGSGQHFIRSRGSLYRVLEITNVDEADAFILFQCTERGIDTQEETHA